MAGYNYNINLNVIVKDKQLSALEKRLNRLQNKTIRPKVDTSKTFDTGAASKYWKYNQSQFSNFQKAAQNYSIHWGNFGRDFSKSASELNRSVAGLRNINSLGRRMGVAREKGSRLMDVGAGVGTYVGLSSLKKILYDIPVQAETNKWLMSTMGDETASSDALYKQLDTTTDRLPISMQSVAQPLYAFKAATGENAEVIKSIIPQFANFGAVVQNMTGSTELAETAMMKLGYGIKGRYAALDQYGITEDALKRAGWSGDEKDVKGYMAAVTKIVGNAEDSMGTFAGRVKLVEKSLARTGKRLWESGIGDALKGVLTFLSSFLEAGNGIFAQLGVGVLGLTTATLGGVAAFGYLLQAIGSMGESFTILESAVGSAASTLGSKFGATSTVKAMDKKLSAGQTPMYYAGIHDYDRHQIATSTLSDKEKQKLAKSKKRDKQFVKTFGWGKETEAQIASVRGDKNLTRKQKAQVIKNIKKSRLNEINDMGFRGRFKEAGRMKSLKALGSSFKGGWMSGNGLGKVTQGFTQMGSVLGGLIGIINPFNAVLVGLGAALAVLAGVFATAWFTSDKFRQHVSQVGQKLMDLSRTFMGFIGDIFQASGLSTEGGLSGVVEVADKILSALEGYIDWVKGVLEGITGKDYYAEEQYDKASKGKDEAEKQIHEYQKAGKEVPKELYDTMRWNYSRMAYFSAPNKAAEATNPTQGGYWKDKGGKYDKIREDNPGWQFSNYASPKSILQERKEYLLGDLGIPGVGKARTYNPDIRQQQAQFQVGFLSNWLFGSKPKPQTQQSTINGGEVTIPLNGTNNGLTAVDESAMNAARSLDTLSGVTNPNSVTANGNYKPVVRSSDNGDSRANVSLNGTKLVDEFYNDVVPGVNRTMTDTNNAINSNALTIGTSSGNVGKQATFALRQAMSGMPTDASNKTGEVSGAINSKSPQVSGAAGSMGSSANRQFGSKLNLQGWASTEIEGMISYVKSKIPDVSSVFGGIASAALGAIHSINNNNSPGNIAKWGSQEVSWMADEVRSKTPKVLSAMSDLTAQLLPKSVKDFNVHGVVEKNPIQDLMDKNPVDVYNAEVKTVARGTPSVTQSDMKVPNTQENSQVVNLTFNIASVDSEKRVQEIKDVVYEVLFFNNETAGRQEPVPLN